MTTPEPSTCTPGTRKALSIGADTPNASPEFLARRRALLNAVSGVVLTRRDVALLDHMAAVWLDRETTEALADLIDRARAALIGPEL